MSSKANYLPWGKDLSSPFKYENNLTICKDGTICPTARNETCCSLKAGKNEVFFNYTEPIPRDVGDLSSFYALAGYSITSSTTLSSSTFSSSSATVSSSPISTGSSVNEASTSTASATLSSKQSTPSETSTNTSASSGSSSSTNTGIGIGIGLGIARLVCLAIFFYRRHRKRNIPVNPLDLPPNTSWHPLVTSGRSHGESLPAEMNGLGRKRFEMNGESMRAELGGNSWGNKMYI